MVKINVLGWFLYGDENVWDNLSGARFESDFYKAACNCIENGERLWMNLLHKLNIYVSEYLVGKEYTRVDRREI